MKQKCLEALLNSHGISEKKTNVQPAPPHTEEEGPC